MDRRTLRNQPARAAGFRVRHGLALALRRTALVVSVLSPIFGAVGRTQQALDVARIHGEVRQLIEANRHEQVLERCAAVLPELEPGDPYGTWFALQAAYACLGLGRIDRGLGIVADHVQHAKEPRMACWLRIVEARLHVDAGRPDLARIPAGQSLALALGLDHTNRTDAEALHEAYMTELRVLLAAGEREQVIELVDHHLEDAFYEGVDGARADLHYDRGLALEQLALDALEEDADDLAEAAHAFEWSAHRYRMDLGPEAVSGELASALLGLARVRLALGDRDAAESALAEARLTAGTAPSIQVLQVQRVVEARLALGVPEPDRAELEALLGQVEQLIERIAERWRGAEAREGRGVLHYRQSRTLLVEHARLCQELNGKEAGARRALDVLLGMQALGTLSRSLGGAAVDVDDVLAELARTPGRGLLVYLTAARGSLVFALDSEGPIVERIGGIHRLEHLRALHVRRLRDMLPEDERMRAGFLRAEAKAAEALGQALFPDRVAARVAGWSAVTVSGFEGLGHVPIGLVRLPGASRRLGQRLAVDTPASLPFAVRLARTPRPDPAGRLLLVGGVASSERVRARWPSAGPLALPGEVSEPILSEYAPDEVRVLARDRASRAGLLEADPGAFSIVQFLVHGVRDTNRARPAALVLGVEPAKVVSGEAEPATGLLFSEDVARLGSMAPTVLLTACRSGVGPQRAGDPHATDLAGAFLGAGARAVLVTQTDVAYGDVARLSAELHRQLAPGGIGLAEGLRRTVNELAEDDPAWPLRYGLVHVVGLGHEPVFRASEDR